jgi:hypothetical protein
MTSRRLRSFISILLSSLKGLAGVPEALSNSGVRSIHAGVHAGNTPHRPEDLSEGATCRGELNRGDAKKANVLAGNQFPAL